MKTRIIITSRILNLKREKAYAAVTATPKATTPTPIESAKLLRSNSMKVTGLPVGLSKTCWYATKEISLGMSSNCEGRVVLELNDNVTIYMMGNITEARMAIATS